MVDLNITNSLNRLVNGEADKKEQMVLGIILRGMFGRHREPEIRSDKMYCGFCKQPLNLKMKDGYHIHRYCKVCGYKIDWNDGYIDDGHDITDFDDAGKEKRLDVYSASWDKSKDIFSKLKKIQRNMNESGMDGGMIHLSKEELADIITVFAHCFTLESKKEEFSEYWEKE